MGVSVFFVCIRVGAQVRNVLKIVSNQGGFLEHVPLHKATNEAANDPELLEKLMAGKVPLVDTIFRCVVVL